MMFLNKITPLNTKEFSEILVEFNNAYTQVIGFYSETIVGKFKDWIGEILKLFPMNLLNNENLDKILSSIFGDADIYAFVFDLHYRFFSTTNTGELVFKERLILNIINGIEICKVDTIIVPNNILNSLTINKIKNRDIKDFLRNNSFLLIIFLILLTKSN